MEGCRECREMGIRYGDGVLIETDELLEISCDCILVLNHQEYHALPESVQGA